MKWGVSVILYFPYHVATIIISPYFTNTEWDEQWNDIVSNGDS
jgi:hypothetical protein